LSGRVTGNYAKTWLGFEFDVSVSRKQLIFFTLIVAERVNCVILEYYLPILTSHARFSTYCV